MRELSIEEKAKRYDEAKARMSRAYNSNRCTIGFMNEIFSELKEENEDERIIKHLITLFKDEYGENSNARFAGIKVKDIIAWLEKQGEKSSDKIVEKARIEKQRVLLTETDGSANIDWDCRSLDDVKILLKCGLEFICTIEANKQMLSESRFGGCYFHVPTRYDKGEKQGEQKPTDKVEPKFHKGDWTVSNLDGKTRQISEVHFDEYNSYYVVDGKSVNLEEYDRLHHLWTIQDAKDGDVLCTYECCEPKIVFILKGTPKKHYALSYHCYYNIMYPHFESDSKKGCLGPNDEDVKPATKEQRDTLTKAMSYAGYVWNTNKLELMEIEQKPAWSEEDESNLDSAIYYIRREPYRESDVEPIVDWLRHLKGRVQPQPKQEWSEEDENRINRLINYFEDKESFTAEDDIAYANWLKSLRPQATWKPSDEQIYVLRSIVTELKHGDNK